MKIIRILLLLCSAGLSSLYGQEKSLSPTLYKNLPADPEPETGIYTLFSFRTGQAVDTSLWATDQWDVGFKGSTLIVNGGANRVGKGGAFLVKGDFEALKNVPDGAQFTVDESDEKTAIPKGSGNGWYEYIFTTHEIKPLPNTVLLIRTADERYAKMVIESYYRDIEGETDSPGRYYTFRYVFQPDGTRNFN